MRRVSHYEHAFRAGRGEQVERVPHPEYPAPDPEPDGPLEPRDPDAGDSGEADPPAKGVDAGVDASGDVDAPNAERAAPAAEAEQLANLAPLDPAPLDPAPLDLTFTSSNIRSARLDPASSILEVTFNSGKSYRYANFSIERMVAWRAARSAGGWFNANVKNRPDAHPLVAAVPAIDADGR